MDPVDVAQTTVLVNEEFWKDIYEEYFHAFLYFAGSLMFDQDEAGDMVADAFVSVLKTHSGFTNKIDAIKYLYTVIRHTCYARINGKKQSALMRTELAMLFPEKEQRSLVALHETLTLREELEKLILQVSEKQQLIIRMFYFEGKSITAIAEILGTTENTVRVEKSRALKKMREADPDLPGTLVYSILMVMSALSV
jgi:RNA polymerase sigma-70 factor (ECF subfamily)